MGLPPGRIVGALLLALAAGLLMGGWMGAITALVYSSIWRGIG